jgi:hypothetical protein
MHELNLVEAVGVEPFPSLMLRNLLIPSLLPVRHLRPLRHRMYEICTAAHLKSYGKRRRNQLCTDVTKRPVFTLVTCNAGGGGGPFSSTTPNRAIALSFYRRSAMRAATAGQISKVRDPLMTEARTEPMLSYRPTGPRRIEEESSLVDVSTGKAVRCTARWIRTGQHRAGLKTRTWQTSDLAKRANGLNAAPSVSQKKTLLSALVF